MLFNCVSNNKDRFHKKLLLQLLKKYFYSAKLHKMLYLVPTMPIQKGFTVCCFLARTIRRNRQASQDAVGCSNYSEAYRHHRMLYFAQTYRRQTGITGWCILLKLTGGRQASQDGVFCSNLPEADRHHRMLSADQTKRRQDKLKAMLFLLLNRGKQASQDAD